jgi:hypothetical protein
MTVGMLLENISSWEIVEWQAIFQLRADEAKHQEWERSRGLR